MEGMCQVKNVEAMAIAWSVQPGGCRKVAEVSEGEVSEDEVRVIGGVGQRRWDSPTFRAAQFPGTLAVKATCSLC